MKRIFIIFLILVASIFGYNYWINTPQYSLLQIQKSVENKDRVLFEKYVDSDQIIEEIVEDISKIFIEQMGAENNSEYSFFNPQILAAGLISLFKPTIENVIEDGFNDFWEDTIENIEDSNEGSLEVINTLNSFEMSYLKQEGKVARLGLERKDPETGEIIEIEFKLNKIENYWKITQIANLEELLREQMDEIEDLIDLND